MQIQEKYSPLIYASILMLAFSAWMIFRLLYPDVMGGVDVYHFKDAGCNMAMGHGFVSNSYVGTESFDRVIWLSQGPLYPYVFGLFASIFGCSLIANNIFELLIACILTTQATFLLTKFKFTTSRLFLLFGLALFSPTGGYEWEPDRPDHLALIFILALVICNAICRNSALRHRLSFFYAGLALITSPYYGFIGVALAILYFLQTQENYTKATVKAITFNILIFLAPVLIVTLIYLNADPTSFSRFLKHARIITNTDTSFLKKLQHGISSAGLVSYLNFIRFLLSTIFLIFSFIDTKKLSNNSTQHKQITGTLLLLSALTLIAFPKQGNYFSAISYISTLIWVYSSAPQTTSTKNTKFAYIALGLVFFLALLPGIITSVIHPVRMHESYLAQKTQIDKLLNAPQTTVDKFITTVPPSHYFLYKKKLDSIFDPNYVNAKHNHDVIGAVVVCRSGRRFEISTDSKPGWYLTSSPSTPPIKGGMIGIFEMKSFWDWGCFMFQKYK